MKRLSFLFLLGILGTLTAQAQIVHNDNVEIEKSGDATLDLTDTNNSRTWQLVSGLAGFRIGYLTGNLTGTNAPFHINDTGEIGIGTTTLNANAQMTIGGALALEGSLYMINDFEIRAGAFRFLNNSITTKNLSLGVNSGSASMTGEENVFFGPFTGRVNTTGEMNTFSGYSAGYNNTTGSDNVFFGHNNGLLTTSGSNNVFFGSGSGRDNTTGSGNTYLGSSAGSDVVGSSNVFLGNSAGVGAGNVSNKLYIGNNSVSQTGGSLIYGEFDNGKVGINTTTLDASSTLTVGGAMAITGDLRMPDDFSVKAGSFRVLTQSTTTKNLFLGHNAGNTSMTGERNIFLGTLAGRVNTTGLYNSVFGYAAGYSNTTGSYNTFLGNSAGYQNATGEKNMFIGMASGYANDSGSENTYMGYQSGRNNDGGETLSLDTSLVIPQRRQTKVYL